MTIIFVATWLIFLSTYESECPPDMAWVRAICMDRFEAPNQRGVKPLIMQSAKDGQKWCAARGKRLCTEVEWERACFATPKQACNNHRMWLEWDGRTVYLSSEIKRLWQGAASGAYSNCRTPSGIYDLRGNVEEWVVSKRGRDWPYALKGGWWAKTTPCWGVNDAHHPTFRLYETGFRCCSAAIDAILVRRIVALWEQATESTTLNGYSTYTIRTDSVGGTQVRSLADIFLSKPLGTRQCLKSPSRPEAINRPVVNNDHSHYTPGKPKI